MQSLAARQYLPRVDVLLNREQLAKYDGPPLKLIMNGWFTHDPDNWVPAPTIIPHFVSFHINSSAADRMLSPRGIDYLRLHSPIGCRDHHTVSLLREKGIDAYFSGCLTLTLSGYGVTTPRRSEDILVDPFFNLPSLAHLFATPKSFLRGLAQGDILRLGHRRHLLRRGLSTHLLNRMGHVTQELPSGCEDDEQKFRRAESCLARYAGARLVITSRIHCALPCLAMGTPVVFLNAFDSFVDTCRFDGLLDLFNRIDFDPDGLPKANFGASCPWDGSEVPENPQRHLPLSVALRDSCTRFIDG